MFPVLLILLDPVVESHGSTSGWPRGYYGLQKPVGGCPWPSSLWAEGHRHHDLEDNEPNTGVSYNNHFAGSVGRNVDIYFCMKYQKKHEGPTWPAGAYCVYKYKDSCPQGFLGDGHIRIDDEDSGNSNKKSGSLPSGQYDGNTRYEFCCRNDGDVNTEIVLPTSKPFYLFPRDAHCQKVKGMRSSMEWLKFDAEDKDTSNEFVGSLPYVQKGRNPTIYHCYYERVN